MGLWDEGENFYPHLIAGQSDEIINRFGKGWGAGKGENLSLKGFPFPAF
jgi:hypothetical protein